MLIQWQSMFQAINECKIKRGDYARTEAVLNGSRPLLYRVRHRSPLLGVQDIVRIPKYTDEELLNYNGDTFGDYYNDKDE